MHRIEFQLTRADLLQFYVFISKSQALVLPHDRIPRHDLESLVSEIDLRRQMVDSPQEPHS